MRKHFKYDGCYASDEHTSSIPDEHPWEGLVAVVMVNTGAILFGALVMLVWG
jgi:hypothetical protein